MLRLLICLSFISLNAQEWERSFTAGELNEENHYLGGSEVLQLVGHQNKLFASVGYWHCLLYTSPSPRDGLLSRMPSSA